MVSTSISTGSTGRLQCLESSVIGIRTHPAISVSHWSSIEFLRSTSVSDGEQTQCCGRGCQQHIAAEAGQVKWPLHCNVYNINIIGITAGNAADKQQTILMTRNKRILRWSWTRQIIWREAVRRDLIDCEIRLLSTQRDFVVSCAEDRRQVQRT